MELGGRGKGKENDRESTIWKHITSVQVEDITTCTESCWKMAGGREEIRENNGRDWNDQTKVYSQQGYFGKPLWTLTLELIMKDRAIK
jgi:hypothetical protein